MDIALWVVAGILAVAYLGAGITKLTKSKEQLTATPNMQWAEQFPAAVIKAIAGAELLGAAGLVVPWATGIFPILTPVAAVGLAVLQAGAAATHLRRGEGSAVPVNVLLLAAAVFLAVGRFSGA